MDMTNELPRTYLYKQTPLTTALSFAVMLNKQIGEILIVALCPCKIILNVSENGVRSFIT